jgi:hypothetical protein
MKFKALFSKLFEGRQKKKKEQPTTHPNEK